MDGSERIELDEDSYIPYAWRYYDGERKANLNHVSNEWNDNNLFAFSRNFLSFRSPALVGFLFL